MKKPMTFLLALGMLISLAACGGTTSGQGSSTPPADSQTTEAASEGSREQRSSRKIRTKTRAATS